MFAKLLLGLVLFFGSSAFANPKAGFNWKKYDHLDPQNLVPDRPLKRAVQFFELNQSKIKNKNYMVVID
ncbi:MAG: hypothetical protein AB7O96_15790, partial [Pseudobdellovibrionaceae bacterium]